METKEYFKNNIMAVDVFNAKYAHKKENGELENVSEVFRRVCDGLGVDETQEIKDAWHNDLMEGWYRPGGSIISGVGSPEVVSLANCTTIPLLGDSIKDIMKCMSDTMHCAAKRQGLGVEMSPLRPAKAKVNNAAIESTGVVPWMTFLNSMGLYVGQKGRLPAILLSLNVGHPDIAAFCVSKSDNDSIVNANISVQITDDFMEAVQADDVWELFFETRHEKITKTVKARELFALISKQACNHAEPGVQYIDAMRKGSMIHQIYIGYNDKRFEIISTNACVTGDNFVHVRVDGKPNIMLVRDVVRLFKEGNKHIEILSFDHEAGIQDWEEVTFADVTRKNAELLEITDEASGKSMVCTPDHEVFTQNRGYVKACELMSSDVLIIL